MVMEQLACNPKCPGLARTVIHKVKRVGEREREREREREIEIERDREREIEIESER